VRAKIIDDMAVAGKQKMLGGSHLLESENDQMARLLERNNGHHTVRRSPVGQSLPKEKKKELARKVMVVNNTHWKNINDEK